MYRFRALVAEQWRKGSVFLIGDAAHQTPPFFGQGMCHGIRDAAQLIWKICLVKKGLADPALLDTYQAEREPHVREIISASVKAGAEVCKLDMQEALARDAEFRAKEAARDRNVAMTDVVPPIRAGVVDARSGGARLPELAVGERRLDETLGGAFVLLGAPEGFAPAQEWRALNGRTLPAEGAVAAWLASRGAQWAIVRPDRYVFASGADNATLSRAMSDLFTQLHLTASAKRPAGRVAEESLL